MLLADAAISQPPTLKNGSPAESITTLALLLLPSRSGVAWQCNLWNSDPAYGHRLVTALESQMRRVLHTLGPLVLIALAAYLGWALVMH